MRSAIHFLKRSFFSEYKFIIKMHVHFPYPTEIKFTNFIIVMWSVVHAPLSFKDFFYEHMKSCILIIHHTFNCSVKIIVCIMHANKYTHCQLEYSRSYCIIFKRLTFNKTTIFMLWFLISCHWVFSFYPCSYHVKDFPRL